MGGRDKADTTWAGDGSNPPAAASARQGPPVAQLAENYLAAGVFSGKALKVFEEATAVCPSRADFQKALSICLLIQDVAESIRARIADPAQGGKDGPAREAVESLFGQFSGSADLAKCLGDVRLLGGCWDAACHAYRLAQSKGYRDDQAIVNSGRLALASADCPSAALAYFGELAMSLGQFPQAVDFLAEALRRSRENREATLSLVDLVARKLSPRLESSPEKQSLLTEIVRACIRMDAMERALAIFREMELAAGAGISDVVKAIARHLIDNEDYRQAFDYLKNIPFDRETKQLVNEITVKLEQRGEIDTAVYLLQYINDHDLVIQEARKLADTRLESQATRELADLCFRSGRYDAAIGHYLHLVRTGATEDLAEFADRIETAAMRVSNPKAEDLITLGEFFHTRRDWRRAETFLERVMDINPEHAHARELLRLLYDNLLKVEPNLGRVRLKSGDLHLAANRPDEAIDEYKRVLESPGYEMEARRHLAMAYMRAGEPAQALEQYRDLPLRPSDLEPLYALHEALMSAGQPQQALEAAMMIYGFDQQYRDVEGRIAQLEQLVQQGAEQPLQDPKMIELIGEQAIGRYRYVEQIGSGGMGVVHKVFDIKNQCVVAMKILRESLTGSSKAIDRFFREARIAATLSHPNIVCIYDYNINNVHGKSYISMEYVDGPSLRDLIEDRFTTSGELTTEYIAEIIYYVAQLCDALETTHLKGIIHRDIKPDNIMITSNHIVKITDFGIVHIEEATFTPTGALIGTPRYMSPEQVRGTRVDCRSDIYAVGVILYEALIGTPPFISGDIAYQHVNVRPTPPREINSFIPEEVEAVIARCLEKDPRQRYQRAKELKLALEGLLQRLYPHIVAHFYKTPTSASSSTIGIDSPQVTE